MVPVQLEEHEEVPTLIQGGGTCTTRGTKQMQLVESDWLFLPHLEIFSDILTVRERALFMVFWCLGASL